MARLKLGMKGRDVVTGVEGILIAVTKHLTGCDRWLIQPPGMNDKGEQMVGVYVDDTRVEIVDAQIVQLQSDLPSGNAPG